MISARRSGAVLSALIVLSGIGLIAFPLHADPASWRSEWPQTDFVRHSLSLTEIKSGGPPKDGIPSIDVPRFERLANGKPSGWASRLADTEPVVSLTIGGDARAYPLRILIWHEIVNDTVDVRPVAVTYCPLCNTALVFDRGLQGDVLDFGTTGKLRHSDLVMYDRQTESWWQQFTGEAIVGAMTGQKLKPIPSRLESFRRFRERFPDGQVLVPANPNARNYGLNPYADYDSAGNRPFLYDGSLPNGIEPMERVIAVEVLPGQHEAWSIELLRRHGTIRQGDLVLTWMQGQTSALDKRVIANGREVGNVTVQRERYGELVDIVYDVPFAFAFHAFRPKSPIHSKLAE
jgi:Protein of unknown function (DUF3179)